MGFGYTLAALIVSFTRSGTDLGRLDIKQLGIAGRLNGPWADVIEHLTVFCHIGLFFALAVATFYLTVPALPQRLAVCRGMADWLD